MSNTPVADVEVITSKDIRHRILRLIQGFAHMALWIAVVFGAAGTLRWTRGWICAAVYFGAITVTGMLIHHFNHDLLEARAKWKHQDTKPFDKIIVAIFLSLVYIQAAVAGLDVVRLHRPQMPFWTVYPGIAIFLVGMALVTWALVTNPYAETTVRIQSDRGHMVISSGPYRFVRHPLYAGSILMYPATALIFGSTWALAVACLMIALLITRTVLEDKTLRRELPGYEDYVRRTSYRLIPGIW